MIDKEFYKKKEHYSYEDLLRVVADLREPDGCPWDRVQTLESMTDCVIEECYEAVNAVREHDMDNLREELGDVLLQVVMYSQVTKEQGIFTIEDVIDELCQKLVRRHTHVFGEATAENAEDSLANWEANKAKEKKSDVEAGKNELERVPQTLPALWRAQKVMKKARKSGLNKETDESLDQKIRNDYEALNQAVSGKDQKRIEDAAGALLLHISDLVGRSGVNAENSLTTSIEQYIKYL